MTRRIHSGAAADVIVFLLFLTIPLAATRLLWDQFTTAKWYALEVLAALWVMVESWGGPPWRWPAFLRAWRLVTLGLLALPLLAAARTGWAWALTPLVERASALALVLCFFRYASRRRTVLLWPARGTAVAALVTNALLSAQIVGADPLQGFSASDGRSALFGNTNMAAQFLGWAFIVLLAARPPRRGPARWLREALLAWTAGHLYFLSSRSVLLGAALALALLVAVRRVPLGALVRIGMGAGLVVAVLLSSSSAGEYLGGARRFKGLGAQYRLALWRSTLPLIADHPMGVGSFDFSHAFPPYQVDGSLPRDEAVEYRHPHNETLRVVAEEGWIFAGLAALLLAGLLRELARSRRVRRGRGERGAFLLAAGAFLVVESTFQFPLAMAVGVLAFALWLGMALASVEPPAASPAPAPPAPALQALLSALVSLGLVAGAARAAWSEYLFVNHQSDLASQDRACRLDPRNLPACVSAAWLESESGHYDVARARTLAVLERSPYYGPALKLLGEVALTAGDSPAGCFYLWLYDALFHGASSVHPRLAECPPSLLASFPREQPIPYYGPFPRRGSDVGR